MRDRISELYSKYLHKNISKEEYEELFDWIGDGSNKHLLKEIIDGTMSDKIEMQSTVKGSLLSIEPETDQISPVSESSMSRRLFYRISAAAAILLLVISLFFVFNDQQDAWIVYSTDFQETRKVDLPDGSIVTLNANSELKWKEGFEKEKERVVNFRGEGFFDITHMEGTSFVVKTTSVDVNVLGTEFNLESRRENTNIFLQEGEVVLKGEDIEPIQMVPGDLVHYNARSKQANKVSEQAPVHSLSWKEGVFTFVDLTGIQILEKMEDIYGKEFIISEPGKLNDVIVVQGLPYTDWNFTREALELALGVKFLDSTANMIKVKTK